MSSNRFKNVSRWSLISFVGVWIGLFVLRTLSVFGYDFNHCSIYHNLRDYDYESCQLNGVSLNISTEGSGEFVCVNFLDSGAFKIVLDEALDAEEDYVMFSFEDHRNLLLSPSPESYEDGLAWVGQLDFDPEVEFVTFPRFYSRFHNLADIFIMSDYSVVQMDSDGGLSEENGLLVRVSLILFQRLFWIMTFLLFPVSLVAIFYFLTGSRKMKS